ncbi:MAG: penicillin-binding protein 1C [Pseudomonadota bacterium]
MAVAILLLDRVFPPPLARLADQGIIVRDHQGQWVHGFTNEAGRWQFAADLSKIDPAFIEELIAIEDQRFYDHPGVDGQALIRAMINGVRAGRIVSGASTITMQTARLLEPRPRTLTAKAIEMIRALQLERRLTKEEILSAYLTLAPYGSNIQGVHAASLIWFQRPPTYLTPAQRALLIALPQAPEARRPDRRGKSAKRARNKILDKIVSTGLLSAEDARQAARDRVPTERHPLPRAAWHLAHQTANDPDWQPGALNDRLTLDLTLQRRAQAMLATYLGQGDDAVTGAIIIVENKSRAVRALVGSSGLERPGGWNDLTRAVRSPGSTLKPFIYAMAFDDGSLAPDQVINDMPRSFQGYRPENFDRTFRGEVRIRDALQHSLNIPAVLALDQVGASRFAAALDMVGVRMRTVRRAKSADGLALALGGVGITMRELATLYTGLANGGEIAPLVWAVDAARPEKTGTYQLISARAAQRITEILRTAPSLAGRTPAALTQAAPAIAFKTGTSYGFRDAWTAGYTDEYTIVVWIGRADGAPRPGETGRKTAAPLLFSLFDLVGETPARTSLVADAAPEEEPALHLANIPVPAPIRDRRASKPQITYPRDQVSLYLSFDDAKPAQISKQRGFVLAARGGSGPLRWFVNGKGLPVVDGAGGPLWRPDRPGFFDIAVTDAAGQSHSVQVRVHAGL